MHTMFLTIIRRHIYVYDELRSKEDTVGKAERYSYFFG